MKKKTLLITIITLIFVLLFTGCTGTKDEKRKKIIEQSKILDWIMVLDKINKDDDAAKEYKNTWYVYTGKADEIEDDYVVLLDLADPKKNLKVFLEEDELKQLKKNEIVYVVGRFKKPSSQEMRDAIVLTQKEIKEYYIMKPIVIKDSLDDSVNEYYDYVYDKKIGQIVGYSVRGNTNGVYKLEYDDKGNLIKECLIIEEVGPFTKEYTYYDDNTIKTLESVESEQLFLYKHEKDSNGNIVKSKSVNIAYNYTTIYEYTYDGNNRLISEKESSNKDSSNKDSSNNETSLNIVKTTNYKYDDFGNVIQSNIEREFGKSTVTYLYALVAKKK